MEIIQRISGDILYTKKDFASGQIQMLKRFVLPPNTALAPHYHEDMQELLQVLKGTAHIVLQILGDPNQIEKILNTGDAILIDENTIHTTSNRTEEPVAMFALGISREAGGQTQFVEQIPNALSE